MTAKTGGGRRALAPLRHRDFRFLVASLTASLMSAGLLVVALVWQVVALGRTAVDLGLVTGASSLGLLLTALLGGVLADRLDRRRILVLVELAKAGTLGTVAALSLTGRLELWHLVAAAALAGLMDGLYYPAFSAFVPTIVPAPDLLAANGIEGALRPVLLNAAGPALAGVIVAGVSPGAALAAAAACSLLAGVSLLPVSRRAVEGPAAVADATEGPRPHPVRAVATDLADGVRYLRRTPWLWATLGFASMLVLLVNGPIEVLVPFAIKDRAGGGPGDHALVLAAFGIGGALASLVVAARPLPRRYLTWMLCAWGFGTLPLAFMGIADRVWIFVVAAVVVGAVFQGAQVVWSTLLQRRVPPELLGRVSSLDFFVSLVFMPVSMALSAPLAAAIGLSETFLLAGVLPPVFAVAALVVARLPADEIAHPLEARSGDAD